MIIPTGYAQINYKGSGSAFLRGWEVTHGLSNTLGSTPSQIAASAIVLWTNRIKPQISNLCTLDAVSVKLGPNATGAEASVPCNVNGSKSSQALPPQTAVLVNKHTALGGRHGRGRFFFPGLTEDQTDGGGILTTAALAAWTTAVESFRTDWASGGDDMYLLHGDATAPTLITELIVVPLGATQRRRIRKVGGRRHT